MSLEGRLALVTGGSRGIGLEICRIFLENGAKVLAVSRVQAKLSQAGAELPGLRTLAADVSLAEDVDRVTEWARREWGRLDILVNNAGVFPGSAPDLTALPDDPLFFALRVNVGAAYLCTKRLLPLLLKSSDPRIVNVGSRSGIITPRLQSAYGVSKAALHALTIATANELKGQVAVNALSPGWVKTDMAPDAPGDPRSSAEATLSLVTRPRSVTGHLFHGQRVRAWATR